MPPSHRSAFSKFRCGVAPLRIETGRYEGLSLQQRICPFCGTFEDESHVILDCHMYDDLRETMFNRAIDIDGNFVQMSKNERLIFLFTNENMIRIVAKTSFLILQRRNLLLCK